LYSGEPPVVRGLREEQRAKACYRRGSAVLTFKLQKGLEIRLPLGRGEGEGRRRVSPVEVLLDLVQVDVVRQVAHPEVPRLAHHDINGRHSAAAGDTIGDWSPGSEAGLRLHGGCLFEHFLSSSRESESENDNVDVDVFALDVAFDSAFLLAPLAPSNSDRLKSDEHTEPGGRGGGQASSRAASTGTATLRATGAR